MVTFRLKFIDDHLGCAKEVEFDAVEPGRALLIAQGEAVGRVAELWQQDRKLCSLRRRGPLGDIWHIHR